MAFQIVQALSWVINIYSMLIIVWCVLSFFPRMDAGHPVFRFLEEVTRPVLGPIRALLPAVAGLDFSPMVALLLLGFIQRTLLPALVGL